MAEGEGRLYWWPGTETGHDGVLIWDQGEPEDHMMGLFYVYREVEERGRADLEHELARRATPAMVFRLVPDAEPRSPLGPAPG